MLLVSVTVLMTMAKLRKNHCVLYGLYGLLALTWRDLLTVAFEPLDDTLHGGAADMVLLGEHPHCGAVLHAA